MGDVLNSVKPAYSVVERLRKCGRCTYSADPLVLLFRFCLGIVLSPPPSSPLLPPPSPTPPSPISTPSPTPLHPHQLHSTNLTTLTSHTVTPSTPIMRTTRTIPTIPTHPTIPTILSALLTPMRTWFGHRAQGALGKPSRFNWAVLRLACRCHRRRWPDRRSELDHTPCAWRKGHRRYGEQALRTHAAKRCTQYHCAPLMEVRAMPCGMRMRVTARNLSSGQAWDC